MRTTNTKIPRRHSAFTLIEILIAALIGVIVLAGLYFFFSSSARQATSGGAKLKAFHRLRMVTEILKDDFREATAIIEPKVGDDYSSVLKFRKYALSMEQIGNAPEPTTPRTFEVSYEFNPKEKRLTSHYKNRGGYINTQLFESVGFRQIILGGQPFLRVKFQVRRDENREGLITVYHTVGARRLSSYLTDPYWHSKVETQEREEP